MTGWEAHDIDQVFDGQGNAMQPTHRFASRQLCVFFICLVQNESRWRKTDDGLARVVVRFDLFQESQAYFSARNLMGVYGLRQRQG